MRLKEKENNSPTENSGQQNEEEEEYEDEDDSNESDGEFQEVNKRIIELKQLNEQRASQQQQFDPNQGLVDDDTTSECDSDYEYLGGDAALYDSALDGADELLFVKESLGRLFEMGGQQLEQ